MDQFQQVFLTWLRASVASVAALWMSGITDPKTLAYAGISGLVGPLLKYLDTSAPEFGRTK
jgi:hypothetical protein